jgi:predicted amidohydrolase
MEIDGNMKSSIENSYLRIASVQIDYQASACLRAAGSPICEPIITEPISNENNYYLNEIKEQDSLRETCEILMQSARLKYLETYINKLQDILTYCFDNKVDLLVFPEYSIPVEAIETLRKFSSDMTIVAGIGYLGRRDIAKLEELEIPIDNVCIANNAAIILSPDKDFIISKKHAAQNENISTGNGPETYNLKFRGNTIRVSVSICLDYLRDTTSIADQTPEIVIVSALSANTNEFTQKIPRDFITVFSNHSLYGGSCILTPEVRGEIFANRNGTVPLSTSLEAIIILDWDCKKKVSTKPSGFGDVKHPIYAISQIVYSGKDDGKYDEISKRIQDINLLMKEDDVNLDRDEIRSKACIYLN